MHSLPAAYLILAVATTVRAAAPPSRVLEITGMDFAFRVPARVSAGRTTIRFINTGKSSHELNIALLKRGVTLSQFMAARRDTVAGDLIERSVGVLFTEPGSTGPASMITDLIGGRDYIVICNHKDTRASTPHSLLGMIAIMHVRPGAAARPALQHVDSIVATDYAFRHPETLKAGTHILAFVNAGAQKHELKVFPLHEGVTLQAFVEGREKGGRARTLADRAVGVLTAGGGASPLGTIQLVLKAGREYALVCDFKDAPDAPTHMTLGMYGSIRVEGETP
jgi:hypothetical protein